LDLGVIKNIILLLLFSLAGCSSDSGDNETESPKICSTSALEAEMTSALSGATTDTDFSLQVERSDGRVFSFNRGSSTPQTSYESASTSKLVTSIIILRLIDAGYLNLTDKPQDYLGTWPIASSDPLYNMNLSQLLSFTSGLTSEPACLNAGGFDFETCVRNIGTTNANNGITAGSTFYYASTHMQVAGLMAIRARGVSTWQNIFSEFKSQTGLFPTSTYDLPSATNPRLAGGMHWTGAEYLDFLRALKNGSLLSTNMRAQLLLDQISSATIGYSPIVNGLNEQWHYGYGLWQECQNSSIYNCTPGTRVSSPGTYGAYPFWDRQRNYIGILARQGAGSTFPNGVQLERVIESSLNEWATCSTN
jgi:CubicO group peptidase (beta-lactamase class C family)